MTAYCKQELQDIRDREVGEGVRAHTGRVKKKFESMLRNAREKPVVYLHRITADEFMEYVSSLRNQSTGDYLSKSAYGSRRSALFHLFRLHNNLGFSEAFKLDLKNLYKGFFRLITQELRDRVTTEPNDNGDDDGNNEEEGLPVCR